MDARSSAPTVSTGRFGVLLRALLSVGLVLGLSSVATLANWEATVSVTPGALSTGELTLLHSGEDFGETTMILPAQNLQHLLPGERAAYTFTVTNAATSDVAASLSIDAWATGHAKEPMRILFYEGGSASNAPVAGGDNANKVAITAGTYRGGSCSGTLISQGIRPFGTEAAPSEMIVASKRPVLQPGQSTTFCYVLGVGLDELSAPTSPDIGTAMTLFFTVRGSQVQP